jgi:hypothetical protein
MRIYSLNQKIAPGSFELQMNCQLVKARFSETDDTLLDLDEEKYDHLLREGWLAREAASQVLEDELGLAYNADAGDFDWINEPVTCIDLFLKSARLFSVAAEDPEQITLLDPANLRQILTRQIPEARIFAPQALLAKVEKG